MAVRLLPRHLVGQGIKGIRNRLGMTQAELARSLGLESDDAVGAWERGESQPDYATLAKIAAMGVVDVLVFHDPQDGPLPALASGSDSVAGVVTPGEAAELRAILARMEALLGEAKTIVERAARRGAVEETVEMEIVETRVLPEAAAGDGAPVRRASARSKAGGGRKSSGAAEKGGGASSSGAKKDAPRRPARSRAKAAESGASAGS